MSESCRCGMAIACDERFCPHCETDVRLADAEEENRLLRETLLTIVSLLPLQYQASEIARDVLSTLGVGSYAEVVRTVRMTRSETAALTACAVCGASKDEPCPQVCARASSGSSEVR